MTDQFKSGVSRRTLAKGAAWAVPAVTIAAAAPAYAVSGNPPLVTGGQAFKMPGNSCAQAGATGNRKAYLFTFRLVNTTGLTQYIYGATIATMGTSLDFQITQAEPKWGTPILPGQTVDIGVWANGLDSANEGFTVKANIFWGHTVPPATLQLPITKNADNPDKLANGDPWHPPVVVGPWEICRTPTLESEGYPKCASPGYVEVYTDCGTAAGAGASPQASTQTTTQAPTKATAAPTTQAAPSPTAKASAAPTTQAAPSPSSVPTIVTSPSPSV